MAELVELAGLVELVELVGVEASRGFGRGLGRLRDFHRGTVG